ncbi:hypothetical protein BE04_15345 [Sorangium cellulosum]|uniref:Uncharacterized protein n=1 Tax=Sorangium cellulosum TaxID=56 RepID=A0A150NZH8_SORCE|nr:hypothetical protein BE04_15345 [Sorangium cellulosum]
MPSRRSSASMSPRWVHAAAARTMRSFSAAENFRLLPGFGTLSTAAPLERGAAPCAAGAGVGSTDRRWEGFGTGQVHSPPSHHRFPGVACLTRRWHRGLALFRVEEECALCSPDERLEIRQRESAPLIEKLFAWAEAQRQVVPEHSPLREGLVYLHNQREALCEFLSNGEIPIHNNASERALRRVVKGRRNWLFHGSDEHAVRACAITSLIATCKMHGLDPELYLQEILTVAPSYPLRRILDLSPKNWVATRQRLIADGRLKYLDLARITGSRLAFRDR